MATVQRNGRGCAAHDELNSQRKQKDVVDSDRPVGKGSMVGKQHGKWARLGSRSHVNFHGGEVVEWGSREG